MKMRIIDALQVMLFVAALAGSASGQGTLVAWHSGANDPVQEGFTFLTSYGSPQVGPVTNDLGRDAWYTVASQSGGSYRRRLGNFAGLDWTLSVNIRAVTPGAGSVFYSFVDTGQYSFMLEVGSESDGDPVVRAYGLSFSPFIALDGAGSTYHQYQLVYSATTRTAALWIDGVESFGGIVGITGSENPRVSWGASFQGSPGFQANWNLVSLEIIPEPSTMALLGLGGALMASRLRRFRTRK